MIVLPRKLPMLLPAALLVLGAGVVGWDFFQLGRKVPEQVPPENRADLIKVDKAARTLTLLHGAEVLKRYQVSLGPASDGHKSEEGDGDLRDGIGGFQNVAALSLGPPHLSKCRRSGQARQRGVSPAATS
jgi:hypothetical protein